MIKLVKKSVAYTDKETGENKTFTKIVLRVEMDDKPIDIEITAKGRNENDVRLGNRLLRIVAEKDA